MVEYKLYLTKVMRFGTLKCAMTSWVTWSKDGASRNSGFAAMVVVWFKVAMVDGVLFDGVCLAKHRGFRFIPLTESRVVVVSHYLEKGRYLCCMGDVSTGTKFNNCSS
jgi:hypothetical protein